MPPADKRIRVMAADDHPLLREGIAAVIREQDDMVMVADAASGREAVEGFRVNRPDICKCRNWMASKPSRQSARNFPQPGSLS
jgi:DNA-binding NarL/FixJ family response regulator